MAKKQREVISMTPKEVKYHRDKFKEEMELRRIWKQEAQQKAHPNGQDIISEESERGGSVLREAQADQREGSSNIRTVPRGSDGIKHQQDGDVFKSKSTIGQDNDERWGTYSRGVAGDTTEGLETARDRGDIRVFEKGLESTHNEHSEYSERDRRTKESERLVIRKALSFLSYQSAPIAATAANEELS